MKQTIIKPGDDISGNCVTLDFDKLVTVAQIAAGKSLQEIRRAITEIEHGLEEGFQTGNYRHADYPTESLIRESKNYQLSAHVLHILTALQEKDNRRETFYLYNITQECETLVQEKEPEL